MAEHNSSYPNAVPRHDPCSASYQRVEVSRPPAVKSSAVRSKKESLRTTRRMKLLKARSAFVKRIRRLLGLKTKDKSAFVMLERSSTRSRPPPTRIPNGIKSASSPAVFLTAPSTRRRSHYRVHSYGGAASPTVAAKNSVRFSHPLVSSSALTAAKRSSDHLSVPEETENEGKSSNRDSTATDDSLTEPYGGGVRPIHPKNIFSWSAQSVTADGRRESYNDFLGRLDGVQSRADRRSGCDKPPSLQFLPRLGTIKLREDDTLPPTSSHKSTSDVEKHRSDALTALEGYATGSTHDRYVLAILPKKDMPTTAVPVASNQYPSSLIPGSTTTTRPPMQRPHTFAAPKGQLYKADNFSSSAEQLETKRKGVVFMDSGEGERLDFLSVDTEIDAGLNERHSKHYKSVESCVFESGMPTPPRTPKHRPSKSAPQITPQRSFLLTPSPEPSDEKPRLTPAKGALKQVSSWKPLTAPPKQPADLMKPLPPTPASKSSPASMLVPPTPASRASPAVSKPVAPISMNANGYPTMTSHPSKRYSAEPKYQRRSIDPVEAKYIKENPKKKGSKIVVGKKSAKDMTEQEKRDELRVLDGQMRKLMGA